MNGELRKWKVKIELCGPMEVDDEEAVQRYINAIITGSDTTMLEDVFAIGEVKIEQDGTITIDEWNGDAIDLPEDF